jgi:uncharacterized protein YybS (DUF2232 family)
MTWEEMNIGMHVLSSILILAMLYSLFVLPLVVLFNYLCIRFSLEQKVVLMITLVPAGIMLAGSFGFLGVIAALLSLGFSSFLGWKFRWSYQKLFLVNFGLIFILTSITVLNMGLVYYTQNIGIEDLIKNFEKTIQNQNFDIKKLGISSATDLANFKDMLRKSFELMALLGPFLTALFSLVMSLILSIFLQYFWRKYQGIIRKNNFANVFLPEKFILIMIAGFACVLLGQLFPNHLVKFIGWNLVFIMVFVYFFQGLSLFYYYGKKWKLDNWLIPAILFLILFFSLNIIFPMIIMLAILGTLDFWKDFRKLNQLEREA